MTSLLRFARRYLAPYLPWYGAGTLALGATNWLSVTIPLYLAEGIDALALGAAGRPVILRSAATVAVMGLVVIVVRTASRLLFFTPGRLVEAQVKHDLFERLLRHQPVLLDRWPTGDLVSRVSSDVGTVRLLAGFTTLGVVNTVVALTLTATQMARISPTLAAWVAVPLLVAFLLTLLFVQRLFRIMRRLQQQAADLSDGILSTFQGIAVVQAFRSESAFLERFEQQNDAYLKTTLERANLRVIVGPGLALAAAIDVFLLLYIGGSLAVAGEITVGELVAFTTLVAYLVVPLRGMSFILSLFKQAQASLERIDEVLEAEPERPEGTDGLAPPAQPPRITVQGLTFAYPGDTAPQVLHDVQLEVPSGETLGILGPTGAGKTTLLRCISRLYNPPRGTVFVDGVDVLDLDLDRWRHALTLVPQRAFLFSESLRDNVLLGDTSDAKLERALALAALEPDVEVLPEGVETQVGEAGVMLSGGQRQRAALARGLVREHALLLLDDVLSAVDHRTEQLLLGSIRGGHQRPTTIVVANRISALAQADRVIVLSGGRVVDQGTHGELISRPGLYRDTWSRQQEREP